MSELPRHILAFDVRPQRLGHAILDTSMRLVDWEVSRSRNPARHIDRVERLLATFQPSVVVLRTIEKGDRRDRPSLQRLTRRIRGRVRAAGITTVYVRGARMKRVFARYGEPTKERVAWLIVACFPEIASQLPPHRVPWKPEHWRMPLFDAVALALAYFALEISASAMHQEIQRLHPFAGPSVV